MNLSKFKKKYFTAFFKIDLLFFVTLLCISFLILLGFWQLSRLKEKNIFINDITINLNNPPLRGNFEVITKLYNKVTYRGSFQHTKNIYLYGRKSMSTEKDGYYLMIPFKTIEGKNILVARGWLAARHKSDTINIIDDINTISGIILPLEHEKLFIPNNDIQRNVWFTLNLKDIENYFGMKFENFYLVEIDPQHIGSFVKPIDSKILLSIKNDHFEYAMTWFGLALALIVIYAIYRKQKNDQLSY